MDNTTKHTLKNGLKVIVKENRELPLVSLHVWVRAGAVNENPRINGISHMMEHMMFKGTKSYSGGEIARTVESWGGRINAATSSEFTFYYIDIPVEALETALKILYEISSSPLFPDDELQKEKGVIIEEIHRKRDMPQSKLWDELRPRVFADSAYRYSVLGDSDVVKNITRDDLVEYFDEHYTAENMVLICAGDIDADEFLPLAEKYFSLIKKGGVQGAVDIFSEPKGPELVKKPDNVSQYYFMGGFVGPDINSPDQYSLDILSFILGRGGSSRLHQLYYEKKNMVWSVSSGFYSNIGSGIFAVNATLKKDTAEEFLNDIDVYLSKLHVKGFSKRELRRAVRMIEMQAMLSTETNSGAASTIGYYAVYGMEDKLRLYFDNLRKVRPKDVAAAAKKYLDPSNFIKVVIYPDE